MADSWAPDGTQEPAPPPFLPDPLAGLVTGSVYKAEPLTFAVAKPTMPDMSEVRRAVDAVFAGDNAPAIQPARAARSRRPAPQRATPPGIVPPNPRPGWPGSAVVRRLPGRSPARGPEPLPVPPARARRSSSGLSAGAGGIIVMIVVVIVIVIIVINSVVQAISGLLD